MVATVIGEVVGYVLVLVVESRFVSVARLLQLVEPTRYNGGTHVIGRIKRFENRSQGHGRR